MELDENAEWLALALTWHVGRAEPEGEDEPVFPNAMKRVILQQAAPPDGAQCGNPYMDYSDSGETLFHVALLFKELGSAAFEVLLEERDVPLLTRGRISGLGYFYEDARRDWLDVISGTGKDYWDDQDAKVI